MLLQKGLLECPPENALRLDIRRDFLWRGVLCSPLRPLIPALQSHTERVREI